LLNKESSGPIDDEIEKALILAVLRNEEERGVRESVIVPP